MLENAAHVDAIITVSAGLMPIGLQSSSEVQIANDALRPLSGVVRSARLAARQRDPALGVAGVAVAPAPKWVRSSPAGSPFTLSP